MFTSKIITRKHANFNVRNFWRLSTGSQTWIYQSNMMILVKKKVKHDDEKRKTGESGIFGGCANTLMLIFKWYLSPSSSQSSQSKTADFPPFLLQRIFPEYNVGIIRMSRTVQLIHPYREMKENESSDMEYFDQSVSVFDIMCMHTVLWRNTCDFWVMINMENPDTHSYVIIAWDATKDRNESDIKLMVDSVRSKSGIIDAGHKLLVLGLLYKVPHPSKYYIHTYIHIYCNDWKFTWVLVELILTKLYILWCLCVVLHLDAIYQWDTRP